MKYRKIIHIDMDAFFASVEQLDNPELKGKPIAVGNIHRGVVAAASYEARKFGIKSAMPSKTALKKCPHLIFVKPRFNRYKEISLQIREIFFEYTDLVEPLSLDEAYLDVTENKKMMSSANVIAKNIRQKIFEKTGLTASAGISINKFLAKIGSDVRKPNGQKTIHPNQIIEFLDVLPIEKFHGIGKITAHKMYQLGIHKGLNLREKPLDFLLNHFGQKSGLYYYNIARGIHHEKVIPHRIPKSIGVEHTYHENISDEAEIHDKIKTLCLELNSRLLKNKIHGKTLTLKIKYKDFSIFTRSRTQELFYENIQDFYSTATELWKHRPFNTPIRLLGISLSSLNLEKNHPIYIQLKIPFEEYSS